MRPPAKSPPVRWPELDRLRGLAAVLMVLSHAGVALLSADRRDVTPFPMLLFAGSFAPVVFYFVTGLGAGIQSGRARLRSWADALIKAAILIAADLLMQWSIGRRWGLDFLGFIGLSVLAIEAVRRTRFPVAWCLAGCIALTLLRFVVGPRLPLDPAQSFGQAVLNWIVGFRVTPGVSYPLSPWMVYPLAGFALGAQIAGRRNWIEARRGLVIFALLAVAAAIGLVAMTLAGRGWSMFRWGTVGLGFFVASFGVLAACCAVACTGPASLVSLRGVASLAFVPIHYALIQIAVARVGAISELAAYLAIVIAITALGLALAFAVDAVGRALRRLRHLRIAIAVLLVLAGIAAAMTIICSGARPEAAFASRTAGQIVLCLLFAIR